MRTTTENASQQESVAQAPSAPMRGKATDGRVWPGVRSILDNKWAFRVLIYGLLLLGWQITAMVMGRFFLPTIPATIMGIVELFAEGHYLRLGPTLQQLLAGFFIAMAIALPVGALMGRFRIMEDILAPYVNTLFVTSKESLLPIIIIAFGVAFWYRVSVVILFALFFPVMNTAAGVRYVDRELKETARAFATPAWRMFTRVYLPAAAPFVVAGTRMGLGMAFKGMVIAELWVFAGTGELFTTFTAAPRRLDLYFALGTLIIIIAVTSNELLKWAERKLRPAMQVVSQV